VTDFQALFELPMYTAIGAALVLALLFRPPAQPQQAEA
jgi:hypothetical protein